MRILVVVDMQNDFIDGVLGTGEALAIVPEVRKKIEGFEGKVIFTRDTHDEDYMDTQEGRNLPVPHCVKDTRGWQIRDELEGLRVTDPVDKPSFGSLELPKRIEALSDGEEIEEIVLIGLCTDICVISNAMIIKAAFPEVPVTVDSRCCAGVTPESHENALKAMSACQIRVI